MEYYIKPFLYFKNEKFWTFSSEINSMNSQELDDLIDSFQVVLSGEYEELHFGFLHISELFIKKEITILKNNGHLVKEFDTGEIYKVFKYYQEALKLNFPAGSIV